MRPILLSVFLLASGLPGFAGCQWYAFFGSDTFVKTGENANGIEIVVEPIFLSKNKRAKLKVNGQYKKNTIEITAKELEDIQKNCGLKDHIWPSDLEKRLSAANPAGVAGPPLSITRAAFSSALVDLNGDDIPDDVDIVLPTAVEVTLSRPNGTFASPVRYTTGPGPEVLLLADFNGDQILDIAVALSGSLPQNTGSVAILLGAANGAFASAVNFAAGVRPLSLAAGDLNGDGKLDLAVANGGSSGFPGVPDTPGGVSILPGNGNGSFQAPTQLSAGNSPSSIVAAHLNSDQNLDLAVANLLSGNITILYGSGGGAFQPAANITVGDRPSYLGVAEFNGDTIADMAVLHRDSATISLWMGNANGTFTANGRYLVGVGVESFAILPLEGFSRPTILSPDAVRARLVMHHVDLDGTLTGSRAYVAGLDGSSLAAADFNRDGKADVVTSGAAGLMVWRSRNVPGFGDPLEIALPNSTAVEAADFNGDGAPDIVASNTVGITLFAGRGDGAFMPPVNLPGNTPPYFLTSADLNGDGARDLIAVDRGNQNQSTVSVFRGTGGGAFQAALSYPAGYDARSAAVGDFNGDDRLDLVVGAFGDLGSNRGGARVFLQNANGSFQAGIPVDAGLSTPAVAAGDFNGDGKLDLAAGGEYSTFRFGVAILLGNGNGTFGQPATLETGFGPGQLRSGDYNGDGVTDLLVVHCCGQTDIALLLGNGDGSLQQHDIPGGSDPREIATADFNGDQKLDIAVIGQRTGLTIRSTLAILENRTEPFQVLPAPETAPRSVAPDSIVSIYGAKLAPATAASPTAQWPLSLGGAIVKIRDGNGVEKDAPIAFASAGQLNIHLPEGLKSGFATVSVTSGGVTRTSRAFLERVVPALFAVDAARTAAAYILRVRPDGSQSLEPVIALNASQQVIPAPIDFGPAEDRLFLLLYGTGFRNATSTTVTVGGRETTVLYAGSQGEFPGLDQANVELPRSLAGAGLVDVALTADGIESNIVKIRFR